MTITATVVPRPDSTYPIIIEPYKIDLSQLGDKVINESPVTIKNVSDKTLKIERIAAEGNYFNLDLPKEVGPGEKVTGKVELLKGAETDSFEKSFTIEVVPSDNDEAARARFTVPVKRTVRVANQAGTPRVLPRGGH